MGPDVRRNLQVNQDGIQGNEEVDKNGWPTPLCDPSNPLKLTVTNGSNGEQRNFDPTSTDGQDQLSLTEGRSSAGATQAVQGGHSNKLRTSQMNPPNHSQPEGE